MFLNYGTISCQETVSVFDLSKCHIMRFTSEVRIIVFIIVIVLKYISTGLSEVGDFSIFEI